MLQGTAPNSPPTDILEILVAVEGCLLSRQLQLLVGAAIPTPITLLMEQECFLTTLQTDASPALLWVPSLHGCSGKVCLILASCFRPTSYSAPALPTSGSTGTRDAEQRAGPSDSASANTALPTADGTFLAMAGSQQRRGQGQAVVTWSCPDFFFASQEDQGKPLAFQPGIWPSPPSPCSRPRILKFVCTRITRKAH